MAEYSAKDYRESLKAYRKLSAELKQKGVEDSKGTGRDGWCKSVASCTRIAELAKKYATFESMEKQVALAATMEEGPERQQRQAELKVAQQIVEARLVKRAVMVLKSLPDYFKHCLSYVNIAPKTNKEFCEEVFLSAWAKELADNYTEKEIVEKIDVNHQGLSARNRHMKHRACRLASYYLQYKKENSFLTVASRFCYGVWDFLCQDRRNSR